MKEDERERRSNGYFLDVSYGKSNLFLRDANYTYYYERGLEQQPVNRIFFFTDRSIYRPGQTVHFKGITIKADGKENNVLPGYKTLLYLRDANYQVIDSLSVTTNEFGSFAGSFVLPETGLTGSFRIAEKGDRNSTEFSVEAYKRPRFAVSFEGVEKAYRVNDTI